MLPEVSVRLDTIEWLKEELRQHCPGLAVLAGTYRHFGASPEDASHLQEKLTLLWQPGPALVQNLGLERDTATLEFQ